VAVLLPEWLSFIEGYYLMCYALLVILLMMFSPTGLLGLVNGWFKPAPRKAAAPEAARRDAAK